MKTTKVICLCVCIFISSCGYAEEIFFDNHYYFDSGLSGSKSVNQILLSDDGDVLKYGIFNLFDRSENSCLAILNSKDKNKRPYFELAFRNNFNADRIVLKNGFQKSVETYLNNDRIKEVKLLVYRKIDKDRFVLSYETNVVFDDKTNEQIIKISHEIMGWYWGFGIMSTYSGAKYSDICIDEIEIWNKKKKYEIANLKNEASNFVKSFIEFHVNSLESLFGVVTLVEMHEKTDTVLSRWGKLGIDKNKIYIGRSDEGNLELHMQISKDEKDNRGLILLEPKNKGKIDWVEGDGGPRTWYRLVDYYKLGEWEVRDNGSLWIKIGNGVWKLYRKGFEDTDFGRIRTTIPIG